MTVAEQYLAALLKCLLEDYAAVYSAAAKGQIPDSALDPAQSVDCRLARQMIATLEGRP